MSHFFKSLKHIFAIQHLFNFVQLQHRINLLIKLSIEIVNRIKYKVRITNDVQPKTKTFITQTNNIRVYPTKLL